MSDLMRADSWMHMVLRYDTPLNICEKRFREFSLEADSFIMKELKDRIILDAKNAGYFYVAEGYEKILSALEKEISQKLNR